MGTDANDADAANRHETSRVSAATADVKTSPHYRWLVFGLLAAAYMLVNFHRLCPAILAVDLMRDLAAGGALTGLLSAAYFYPYALMQVPAGLLADSWGTRRTVSVFFLIAALGSLVLGLAASARMAVVGRLLVGLGVAMVFVPTLKIMAEWFRRDEFVQVSGILVAMGGLGSLSAATPLVWLNTRIGWRGSFFVVSAMTLVLAALIWIFVRDRPRHMGQAALPGDDRAHAPRPGLLHGIRAVLLFPRFWPLAMWLLLIPGIYFTFAGLWGGPYLLHVYHLSQAKAGRILSLLSIGAMVGGPLLSAIAQRLLRRRKPVLITANVLIVGITAILAFRTAAVPLWGLCAICLLIGVFAGAAGVLAMTINKESFPPGMVGTATGLANLFPFVGGGIMQPLLGYLLERHGTVAGAFTTEGYAAAFLVFFAAAVLSLPLSVILHERPLEHAA